jgi:hypothetical protein
MPNEVSKSDSFTFPARRVLRNALEWPSATRHDDSLIIIISAPYHSCLDVSASSLFQILSLAEIHNAGLFAGFDSSCFLEVWVSVHPNVSSRATSLL